MVVINPMILKRITKNKQISSINVFDDSKEGKVLLWIWIGALVYLSLTLIVFGCSLYYNSTHPIDYTSTIEVLRESVKGREKWSTVVSKMVIGFLIYSAFSFGSIMLYIIIVEVRDSILKKKNRKVK